MPAGGGTLVNHSSHRLPSDAASPSAFAWSSPSGSRRMPSRSRTTGLQIFNPRGRVAEAIQLHAHTVHERQVQAAGLALVVRLREIVEDAARLEGPAPLAGQQDRQLPGAVRVAVEQAGGTHQDRVVEQRAVPFADLLHALREVGELFDVVL